MTDARRRVSVRIARTGLSVPFLNGLRMMKKLFDRILVPLLFLAAACSLSLPMLDVSGNGGAPGKEPEEADAQSVDFEISAYDRIFKLVGGKNDIDWRLMSAMAYNESLFREDVVSPRGAVGLMQIMPYVAKGFGVTGDELLDPEVNVEVAAQLMKSVEKMMRLPRRMPYSERLPLILACYNGGYGHITDARNLASYYGEDCNSWEVVSEYLELLAEEDFYNHEVVCYGEFSGSVETISYVDKVIRLYDDYCERFPEKGDDKRG